MRKLLFAVALLLTMTVVAEERAKINASEHENYVTIPETTITADADGCIKIPVVLDKAEEKEVRTIVKISCDNDSFVCPLTMPAGNVKGALTLCKEDVSGRIVAGKTYTVKIIRVILR